MNGLRAVVLDLLKSETGLPAGCGLTAAGADEAVDALSRAIRLKTDHVVELITCQRAEWYFFSGEALGLDTPAVALSGQAAANHLFRVACACESLLVGETQILGQVRQAVAAARANGMLSRELDHLFQRAIAAGRRAQSLAPPGLIASLADLSVQIVGREAPACGNLLVIGTGQTAQLAASAAMTRGWAVTLAGRDAGRTARAVVATNATTGDWGDLPALIAASAAVIAAQKVVGPTVLLEHVVPVASLRPAPALSARLWVDLSSPPCIHASVASLPLQRVLNLMDLAGHIPPAQRDYLTTAEAVIQAALAPHAKAVAPLEICND